MIYEYHCEKCNKSVDIAKPVKDYDKDEFCECGYLMQRHFAPQKIHLYNTKVQESYFSHALGKVVKGDNDLRQQAKQRGWIEVGNEKPEKHLKVKQVSYDD